MTREEFIKDLPQLAESYKPEPVVLAQIRNLTLLMMIGPTGAGKSTLINHLGIKFVPSDTTREPRLGEKEGIDFYFRKDYRQIVSDIKAGQFVQIAIGPTGDFYATKALSYPSEGTATMPIVADVIPIFRELGFKKTISSFITPPSYEEWMRRMAVHSISDEERAKRLKEARRSFEFALSDEEVHFILNDDVETAAGQVNKLLVGQIDKRLEDKARQIAQSLLAALD